MKDLPELKGKEFEYVKGINTKKDRVQIRYCIDTKDVIQAFSKLKKEIITLKKENEELKKQREDFRKASKTLFERVEKYKHILSKRAKEAQQSIALKDEQIKKVFDDIDDYLKRNGYVFADGKSTDLDFQLVATIDILKKKHLQKL